MKQREPKKVYFHLAEIGRIIPSSSTPQLPKRGELNLDFFYFELDIGR